LFTFTDPSKQDSLDWYMYQSDIDIDLIDFLESCDEGIRTLNRVLIKKKISIVFEFSDLIWDSDRHILSEQWTKQQVKLKLTS